LRKRGVQVIFGAVIKQRQKIESEQEIEMPVSSSKNDYKRLPIANARSLVDPKIKVGLTKYASDEEIIVGNTT
jgi:hypothetical protein